MFVHPGGLSVEGGDAVESGGVGSLGGYRGSAWVTGGRPRRRHYVAPMACSRARDTARWRSWEAVMAACMVAMAVTSVEDAGGGGIDDTMMPAHVVPVMTSYRSVKPGSRRRGCCCAAEGSGAVSAGGGVPGRDPRPEIKGAPSPVSALVWGNGGRRSMWRRGDSAQACQRRGGGGGVTRVPSAFAGIVVAADWASRVPSAPAGSGLGE
jgi:hypothetical protein